MPKIIERPRSLRSAARRVRPSIVDPRTAKPFTFDQQLEPFGSWVGDPVWVPPKDASTSLAESMLQLSRPFTSKAKRWESVVDRHRQDFTQVREFELSKASIRLPKGRFFVSVTEQRDFDKITETIPACVQTRLDEFLNGPGKKASAKVYYLKPLCVELDDQLILTTGEDLTAAISKIQEEVFAIYRRIAIYRRTKKALVAAANVGLAIPRGVVNHIVERRQKAIDAYQARLEFKRRKTALSAARTYRKCRTDECTFDDMLELTSPLRREDVIVQYCVEKELSKAKRDRLLQIATDGLPWFMALSMGGSFFASVGWYLACATPPVIMCDPAFVAEMPGSRGALLKIGHFDEVDGITHVEI